MLLVIIEQDRMIHQAQKFIFMSIKLLDQKKQMCEHCALRTGSWDSSTTLQVDVGGSGRIGGAGGDGGRGSDGSNGNSGW